MLRIAIFIIATSMVACKSDHAKTGPDTAQKTSEATQVDEKKDQENIKKTLRELANIENNIQGALAISAVVKSRSKDQNTVALADLVSDGASDVIIAMSQVSAQTKLQAEETRSRSLRDVAASFETMTPSEIDDTYKDWLTKFCLKISNSVKSINRYEALETSSLDQAVEQYINNLQAKL